MSVTGTWTISRDVPSGALTFNGDNINLTDTIIISKEEVKISDWKPYYKMIIDKMYHEKYDSLDRTELCQLMKRHYRNCNTCGNAHCNAVCRECRRLGFLNNVTVDDINSYIERNKKQLSIEITTTTINQEKFKAHQEKCNKRIEELVS